MRVQKGSMQQSRQPKQQELGRRNGRVRSGQQTLQSDPGHVEVRADMLRNEATGHLLGHLVEAERAQTRHSISDELGQRAKVRILEVRRDTGGGDGDQREDGQELRDQWTIGAAQIPADSEKEVLDSRNVHCDQRQQLHGFHWQSAIKEDVGGPAGEAGGHDQLGVPYRGGNGAVDGREHELRDVGGDGDQAEQDEAVDVDGELAGPVALLGASLFGEVFEFLLVGFFGLGEEVGGRCCCCCCCFGHGVGFGGFPPFRCLGGHRVR